MQYRIYYFLVFILVLLDLESKILIQRMMTLGESIQLLPFLNFTYVHNYGVAFSFFADMGGSQVLPLIILSIAITIYLVYLFFQTPTNDVKKLFSLTFIIAGALGNIIDRVYLGYVVDFVDVFYGSFHWPVFNLADSFITLGAISYLLFTLKEDA